MYALLQPLLVAVVLAGLELATGMPALSARSLAEVVVCVLVLAHPSGARPDVPPVRTAFVGTAGAARRWERSLAESSVGHFFVLGSIAVDGSGDHDSALGTLDELGGVVSRERIELLVIGDGAPLMRVLERLSWTSLALPVRVVEASRFCEDMLGHVPVTEIDAAWFAELPRTEAPIQAVAIKRAIDVTVALLAGLLLLPLLAVLILLVRRRGAPAIFKQVRVGEGGRPFTLYKLRTMHGRHGRVGLGPRSAGHAAGPQAAGQPPRRAAAAAQHPAREHEPGRSATRAAGLRRGRSSGRCPSTTGGI